MTAVSIRYYDNTDLSAVCELSADTAFFGEPVEAFLEDRRLYVDAFARYYLLYETPYAWVAVDAGEVVGFLFGCVDTAAEKKRWQGYLTHHVLRSAIKGRYKLGRRTASFAKGMLDASLKKEKLEADLEKYPAHLQIGVRRDQRGKGTGKKLIQAYLHQLRRLGLGGVHLETTSHNIVACYVYEGIGFQLLNSCLNRYWTRWFGYQIDDRLYGLLLR